MWFQKLLPDLKDKQASNCETGRGKSPAQLLLHTHTHTHSDERCAWLSIDSGSVDPTGMSDSCSLHTLTHLHTHTHVCAERDKWKEIPFS